eukprot:TRINITY_DN1024_c0_g1_i10.p1 TRINITY_DN1024_c0_g1~~TRINITY_DN1024_c0_g1_i10.p1  ORF type:complete len:260 (+),score=43.84 TRINITY_DN1024_c0_g1_i10:415-1194(+)
MGQAKKESAGQLNKPILLNSGFKREGTATKFVASSSAKQKQAKAVLSSSITNKHSENEGPLSHRKHHTKLIQTHHSRPQVLSADAKVKEHSIAPNRQHKVILKQTKQELRLGESTQDVSGKVRIERLKKKLKELASRSAKVIPQSNPASVPPAEGGTSFPGYGEVLTTLNRTQHSLANMEESKHHQIKSPLQTSFKCLPFIDGKREMIIKMRDGSIENLRERMKTAREKLDAFKDRLKKVVKNYAKAADIIKQQLLNLA